MPVPSYKWQALFAVCFGTYMATMDFSIVNVALPTLADEFNRRPDTVVWATLAANLVVTGLTLTAGRTGDMYGRKRVYIAGWVVFTIGMALAGFAQGIGQLIALRVFQAVGMALAIANGNAIVTAAFPDNERGRALGMVGSVVGAGLMSGPIFGGVILGAFGWQAIFYLRVPIGLAAMLLAFFFIRESGGEAADQRRLDIPGAVTIFAALSSALLAVNRGQIWGWTSPAILGLFVLAAASFAAFIRIESRTPAPVVSLSLFRVRAFSVGVLSLVTNFLGQSAATFLMPFYLISVLDYGTAKAGFVIATIPAMMLLLSSLSGYVSDRFGFRHQTTLGLAIVALGLLSLSTLRIDEPAGLIMARLAVIGVGSAIFMSPNSSGVLGSVPRTKLGVASASVATARNIGNAAGLALTSAVLVGVASASAGVSGIDARDLPPAALLDGVRAAFLAAAVASSFAVLVSYLGHRHRAAVHEARADQSAATTPPSGAVVRD
ncbi:MAG: MFS transporter [Dehalococcoidia bacterium]